MAYLLQQLANAVPLAALYAALAFGYAVAFGVMKRADITYGALFAFAGQMLVLFTDVGYTRMFLILPAALAFGALIALSYTLGTSFLIAVAQIAQHDHRRSAWHDDHIDGDSAAGFQYARHMAAALPE
jgi:branched-chain amino acid transport system permease protein